jgi:hypothetical protein
MDIYKIGDFHQTKSISSNKIDNGNGFKQVLDQKLFEVKEPDQPIYAGIKNEILEQGDKITSLLDDYAKELADPSKTLKDIEPLIENIEKEVDIIESKVAGEVRNDDEFEGLVKALTVTANVAAFKFRRGDYI